MGTRCCWLLTHCFTSTISSRSSRLCLSNLLLSCGALNRDTKWKTPITTPFTVCYFPYILPFFPSLHSFIHSLPLFFSVSLFDLLVCCCCWVCCVVVFTAADVTQTVNFLLTTMDAQWYICDDDLLALFLACMFHDYKHPGVAEQFSVEVGHEYALLFNDIYVCSFSFLFISFPVLFPAPFLSFNTIETEQSIIVSIFLILLSVSNCSFLFLFYHFGFSVVD